jgi:hypothetical protein
VRERFPVAHWLFSINADTCDNRDALLAAVVGAAKSASRE